MELVAKRMDSDLEVVAAPKETFDEDEEFALSVPTNPAMELFNGPFEGPFIALFLDILDQNLLVLGGRQQHAAAASISLDKDI